MALLQELYQDLIELSNKIKLNVDPKDVEEFQNTLNRSIPSTNSPDWLRYEEFRLSFQRGGHRMINDIRKCKDDDVYRSRVLWTSANHIVQEFELDEILYIEWQRDKYYKIFLKQTLDNLPDPLEAGYSFEYKNDTPKQKPHYRQRLTSSMPDDSKHHKTQQKNNDEGFVHIGTEKKQQKKFQNKTTSNSKPQKHVRSDGFETVPYRKNHPTPTQAPRSSKFVQKVQS
ncbi:MAG: hypothetical protein ACRC1D_03930, partial [Culicoidibacterales bacterium]